MEKGGLIPVLLVTVLVASGCMNGGEGSQTLPASDWCPENGHGEAVTNECVEQTDAIGITSSEGGQLYYAEDNEKIDCPEGQLYICEE